VEIVALAGGVANEIQEQLEEGPLMISFVLLGKTAVEYLQDCLQGVLQEDVRVVACDQLVGNNDKFRVVLDVSGVNGLVVRRNRLFHFLQSVVETVFEKVADLILLLVEYFLQTLQEWLDLFPCSVKPLLEHVYGSLLLLVALVQLREASFWEKFLPHQFAH